MQPKQELSSLDIFYLLKELKPLLIGARFQKFYQNDNTLYVQLHIPRKGTNELVISLNYLALTKYKTEKPQKPTNFAMALRKHLGGKRIKDIRQIGFDRIIFIETETHDLVIEMFSNGNIIFKDKENKIWSVLRKQKWKDRDIKIHGNYEFPPLTIDALNLNEQILSEIIKDNIKLNLSTFLTTKLSFGSIYSKEILLEGNIKDKPLESITEKDKKIMLRTIDLIKRKTSKPNIVEDLDVCPFLMKIYSDKRMKFYDSFNEAVDDYFSTTCLTIKKGPTTTIHKYTKRERLEHRLENQEKSKKEISEKIEQLQEIGTYIIENYQKIEYFLNTARNNINELKKLDYVKKIDEKTKTVTINVDGKEIELSINDSAGENSENYFSKAKHLKNKLKGLEEAIKETKKEMRISKKIIFPEKNWS